MIDSQEICLHCPAVNSTGSSSCHECGRQLAYEEVWLFGGSRHNTKLVIERGMREIRFNDIDEDPSLSWEPITLKFLKSKYDVYKSSPHIVANKRVFVHNDNSEEHNPYRYIFNQMKRYGFYKEMDECL